MDLVNILKSISEFMEKYGIDVLLIAAIIGITFTIRKIDKGNKLKNWFYVVPYLVAALLVALWSIFEWREFLKDTAVYGTLAFGAHNFYTRAVKRKAKG
jgi:RsiW-degrading membrane proteinase PrsW (M82 family)